MSNMSKQELVELIQSTEEGGGDTTGLKALLAEVESDERKRSAGGRPRSTAPSHRGIRPPEEEMTTQEYLEHRVGYLFAEGITSEVLEILFSMDRDHNLKELKRMCVEVGLSPNADKKSLAAKLLARQRRMSVETDNRHPESDNLEMPAPMTAMPLFEGGTTITATAKPVLLLDTVKQMPQPNIDMPYYWMTPKQKEQHLMLCPNCSGKTCHARDKERWTGWKLPARTIKAWGSALNLAEGCNIQRALLLRTIAREHRRRTPATYSQPPLPNFIKEVRVGSHQVWHEAIGGYKAGRGWHEIVTDYKTAFHDCLPGKEWLKEHYRDVIPEPTIEITVDGGKSFSVNGNYKQGVIKGFMKEYCRPGEGKIRLVKVR